VCKRHFACNGTVVEHSEYGEVIQFQGFCIYMIIKIIFLFYILTLFQVINVITFLVSFARWNWPDQNKSKFMVSKKYTSYYCRSENAFYKSNCTHQTKRICYSHFSLNFYIFWVTKYHFNFSRILDYKSAEAGKSTKNVFKFFGQFVRYDGLDSRKFEKSGFHAPKISDWNFDRHDRDDGWKPW